MDFKNELKEKLSQYNILATDYQIKQFEDYYNLIIEWNEKINLTSITEQSIVITKHFIDSILPINHFPLNSSVIDIGSGAGFPAIPLKIIRPDLKIVMVDSLNKRINFLIKVIESLNLQDISAIHGRCEDMANNKTYRQSFDIATARAVAKINILAEYCVPFVKLNGLFIAYKSIELDEEIHQSKNAFDKLFINLKEISTYQLEDNVRKVAIFKKQKDTPKTFPRNQNKPRTQPL